MRTIKFRGLRTDGKGWVYGSLIIDYLDKCWIIESALHVNSSSVLDDIFIEVIPKTVGQFTGLTDKNGVEIFEWDKLGNNNNLVEWGNDGWCINGDRPLYLFVGNNEVIGNIHQK